MFLISGMQLYNVFSLCDAVFLRLRLRRDHPFYSNWIVGGVFARPCFGPVTELLEHYAQGEARLIAFVLNRKNEL